MKSERKSWTDLTTMEKLDDINGDLCLMSLPASSGIKGAFSRWDELQYAHIAQSDYIHGVGAFLPFHRYFVTVHEHLLKTECNYTGPLPKMGFGGNGTGTDRYIADGPFANLTLRFMEDLTTSSYYISCYLNDRAFSSAAQSNVDTCLGKETFVEAWRCYEGMVNPLLSPGDPIFYLHHGYLDKLWWDWQSENITTRLTDIGGNNTASGFPSGFNFTGAPPFGGGNGGQSNFTAPPGFLPLNPSGPLPFPGMNKTLNKALTDYFNDGGNITTLNHTLWSASIMENITIADVMDPRGGFICAQYL
ncbi:Di-copper centre-containing protein [Biscogniauxia marginata]|nr:Di-copper centre-containing protein [Biscogniauxia marginata]